MSEISVEICVSYEDEKRTNALHKLLSDYDHDTASRSGFERELNILKEIGVNGDKLFNEKTADCTLSDLELDDAGSITFDISCGTISGPAFLDNLADMLIATKPREVTSIAFNDQVGEYEVYYYDGKETKTYCTGADEESDELLYNAMEDGNTLESVKRLLQDDRLKTPEHEPEYINGFDTRLFENEELYDAKIAQYLKRGVLAGIAILLIGWLALDFFWTALISGILVAVFITFKGAIALDNAKDEYDAQLEKAIAEDMDELGINEDQAAALLQTFENVVNKATEKG